MRGFESHPYIPNSVPDVQAEMLKEIGMSFFRRAPQKRSGAVKIKRRDEPAGGIWF